MAGRLAEYPFLIDDREIILLCRSGMRSQMAAIAQDGYDSQKLYNLDGGIMAWSNQLPSDIE